NCKVLPSDRVRKEAAGAAPAALGSNLVRDYECPGGCMTFLNRLASIARWTFRRAEAERDLEGEMETFVEMAAAEQMENGHAPADARRRAVLELGGKEQVKERVRTLRHGAWLDEAAQDIRHAIRMFIRNP